VVHGDGSQTRDFVNVRDVVRALIDASTSAQAPGNVYNIGRGEPTSVLDLARNIIEAAGSKSEISFVESRDGDVNHSLADISAAKRDLGFKPEVDLKEGITGVINRD